MNIKTLLFSTSVFVIFWIIAVHIITTYLQIYDIEPCWIMTYGYFVGLTFMAVTDAITDMVFKTEEES